MLCPSIASNRKTFSLSSRCHEKVSLSLMTKYKWEYIKHKSTEDCYIEQNVHGINVHFEMITTKIKALLLKASITQSLHGQISGFSPASAHKSNVKTSAIIMQSNVRS